LEVDKMVIIGITAIQNAIYSILKQYGPISQDKLGKYFDMYEEDVLVQLKTLKDLKYVEAIGDNRRRSWKVRVRA